MRSSPRRSSRGGEIDPTLVNGAREFLSGFDKMVADAKQEGNYDDQTCDAMPEGLYRLVP